MKKIVGRFVRAVLGIDSTEIPTAQINYLRDVASNRINFNINKENLIAFMDSLKDKHDIEELTLFKKGVAIFSSEEDLESVTVLNELFERTKPLTEENLLMLKDKLWITIYEREQFVFIIKKFVKLSQIEINALTLDVLKNLDNVLLEEKQIMETIYGSGLYN